MLQTWASNTLIAINPFDRSMSNEIYGLDMIKSFKTNVESVPHIYSVGENIPNYFHSIKSISIHNEYTFALDD